MPNNELIYVEESKYLLFNKTKGIWICIDDIGKDIYLTALENEGEERICEKLSEMYGASPEDIRGDVEEFLRGIRDKGFWEEIDGEYTNGPESSEEEKSYPYNTLIVSVTDFCNLDCIYCFNKEDRTCRRNRSITYNLEKLKTVFRVFKNNGGTAILLTGGEPFLYHDLREICGLAHGAGLKTSLITNTTILSEVENLEEVLKELDEISLSLDSIEKDELSILWNRNEIDLGKIEKGLLRLNVFSRDVKKMRVSIMPIVTKVNSENLYKLIEKVREWLNECLVKIKPTKYLPIDDAVDKKLEITEKEYVDAYIKACEKADVRDNGTEFNAISHNGKYHPHLVKETMLCKPSLFIQPNGNIYPCQHLLGNENYLGNVDTDDFNEVLKRFIGIMNKENRIKDQECLECTLKEVCSLKGGICAKGHRSDCRETMIKLMSMYVNAL